MAGRMNRSGARDDSSEPTSTAGTLPRASDVVTDSSTWPKVRAPRAAARVSGTAWVRSVPTSWFAPSAGYRNNNRTIISEPDPTEVIPTMTPPTMPMATVARGRSVTSCTTPPRR